MSSRPVVLEGVLMIVMVSGSGCATNADYNAKSMDEIRPRAAFEMHCSPQELKFTPLADHSRTYRDGIVVQYGVDGCGQQQIYVKTSSGWLANTAPEKK